jgi:N-formylglutamate amidohydrolase
MRPAFTFAGSPSVVFATAVHAGHELRPDIARCSVLDDATRLREEDPFTDRLVHAAEARIVAHRSRFEVDLNRPREHAVYRVPDDAWGLECWRAPLRDEQVEASLRLYDEFYAECSRRFDAAAERGPFVVLDLHSYNHRRGGPDAPPAPPVENPEVNVGTGSVDPRWRGLVDGFMQQLGRCRVLDRALDVRENVRFRGGEFSRWVNRRYGERGCALAIEFKKTFMDEWTGALDQRHLEELQGALATVVTRLPAELSVTSPR